LTSFVAQNISYIQNKNFQSLILFLFEGIQNFTFLSVLYCFLICNLKYVTTTANVVIIFLLFKIFLPRILDD